MIILISKLNGEQRLLPEKHIEFNIDNKINLSLLNKKVEEYMN